MFLGQANHCNVSRASGLLSAKVLYLGTSIEKNKCATKFCAIDGSLNNPFSTLKDAQHFYRTQDGACSAVNPITYVFLDNGTYGSPDSMFTLCAFENIVAPALNTNLIGTFVIDGTGTIGRVNQTIAGVNFGQNSSLLVKNFAKGVEYFLNLQNVNLSVDLKDLPVATFEIGQGSMMNIFFDKVSMTNVGDGDLTQIIGYDEQRNDGTRANFFFENLIASAIGSCVDFFSPSGYEYLLLTIINGSFVTTGSKPMINVDIGNHITENQQIPLQQVMSTFTFQSGRYTADTCLWKAIVAGAASINGDFNGCWLQSNNSMTSTIESWTLLQANSLLKFVNCSLFTLGMAVAIYQASSGTTSFDANGLTMCHSTRAMQPIIQWNGSSGTLSCQLIDADIRADNHPDIYGVEQAITGSCTYVRKCSVSSFSQKGPLAHLFQIFVKDNANVSTRTTDCHLRTHSGTLGTEYVDTYQTISDVNQGNFSEQEYESFHSLFKRETL